MSLVLYLSLAVAIVGALVYLIATDAPLGVKLSEIGRLSYAVGLFVFLLQAAPRLVDLFK